MTQVEQIKAEIERLKAEAFNKINHNGKRDIVTDVANSQRIAICEQLLYFINSLPAEQPKLKVRYAGKIYDVIRIKELPCGITMYGIEDEPNHIDYVLPENCEIFSDYGYGVKEKGSPYPTKFAIFSEQKPSEHLEEEIKRKYKSDIGLMMPIEDFRKLILYFVKWQKEQMMKSAIDATITSRWKDSHVCLTTKKDIPQIYNGDKVKILIIKEDKQCSTE